jgi:hypothetical protein
VAVCQQGFSSSFSPPVRSCRSSMRTESFRYRCFLRGILAGSGFDGVGTAVDAAFVVPEVFFIWETTTRVETRSSNALDVGVPTCFPLDMRKLHEWRRDYSCCGPWYQRASCR